MKHFDVFIIICSYSYNRKKTSLAHKTVNDSADSGIVM